MGPLREKSNNEAHEPLQFQPCLDQTENREQSSSVNVSQPGFSLGHPEHIPLMAITQQRG